MNSVAVADRRLLTNFIVTASIRPRLDASDETLHSLLDPAAEIRTEMFLLVDHEGMTWSSRSLEPNS